MKKRAVLKGLSYFLVINLIGLFLAGCGADNSLSEEDGSDIVSSAEPINDSADSLADSEDGQINIMENPAYSAMGRQVVTAVIARPFLIDDVLEQIRTFNENNSTYFVEPRGYEGDLLETTTILETQLTLEVLSGEGPDLVIWNDNYAPSLASGKLMENLYDFMDADPDFHREDYYENILQAFEIDGGLYVFPVSFSVGTICVRAEEFDTDRGVAESWEMEDMLNAFENSSQAEFFSKYYNREYTLHYVGAACVGNFVDWGSGECCFDTPEFIALLEFCNTLPDGFEGSPTPYYDYSRNGKIFMSPFGLYTPMVMAQARYEFGTDALCWPGWPVVDKERDLNGGIVSCSGGGFSICKNSSNQEGAWEFIKSFLTEEAQREAEDNPILRSVSEERIQEAMTVEYEIVNGVEQEKVRHEVIRDGAETIRYYSITEEDAELYRYLIEQTSRSSGGGYQIMGIILEEAEAYYAGEQDVITTADRIQNRVSVYVSECVN
ncbi:MAG: extracellular solute-binding protein [Candidatus Gastranaerophilales bacterium]|nr:extracellular solute-binding protein [Candidatus Gastranaerophilales bacterium]